MYYTNIYVYKSFPTILHKGFRENIKKKKRRDVKIGEYKLNEMGALNMKQKVKQSG